MTTFLKVFEQLYKDYRVVDQKKCERVGKYYNSLIKRDIEEILSTEETDQTGLKRQILKEYSREDIDQQIETLTFLEQYYKEKRTSNEELLTFYRRYNTLSIKLYKKGLLSKFTRYTIFLRVFNKKIYKDIYESTNLDFLVPEEVRQKPIFKAIKKKLNTFRSYSYINRVAN